MQTGGGQAGSPQPSELGDIKKKIKTIVDRMETAIQKKEFEKAAFYRDEEMLQRGVFLNRELLNRSLASFKLAPI